MKAFYSIIVIIGVVGILIGFRAIYVGQDMLSNAENLASMSQITSSMQNLTDRIKSGNFSNSDESLDKYFELQQKRSLESNYKEKGQSMMVIGVIISVVGLLFILFGKAKFVQVSQPPEK